MIEYNPRCNRDISDIEKMGIKENLLKCIENNFGEVIADTYRPSVKEAFKQFKTKYHVRDYVFYIKDDLSKVFGKKCAEEFSNNLEHKLGYDILFKGGVEIKSQKVLSSGSG